MKGKSNPIGKWTTITKEKYPNQNTDALDNEPSC